MTNASCAILKFNPDNLLHTAGLTYEISKALKSVKEGNEEESFIEALSQSLKSSFIFDVKYDSNLKEACDYAYQNLLLLIINILRQTEGKNRKIYLKMSLDKLISCFKEIALPNFGIIKGKTMFHIQDWDFEEAKFGIDSDTTKSYKESKNDIFQTAEGSQRYAYLTFAQEIREISFANFKSGILVATEHDLNLNINNYKLGKFKLLVEYLNTKGFNFEDQIWNESGKPNYANYSSVLSTMYKIIKDNQEDSPDLLNESYYTKLDGEESPYFDAVIAYYKLNYFDDLLLEALGLTISSPKGLKNGIQSKGLKKYSWSDTESGHKVKNWNENGDDKSAIDNTSKFTKLILATIPLKDFTGNENKYNTVGAVKFTQTMTKLFSLIGKLSKGHLVTETENANSLSKLYTYILNFHDNPSYYAFKIFQLISDPEYNSRLIKLNNGSDLTQSFREYLKDKLNLSDIEMAVIDSIYDYIYAYNNKDSGDYNKYTYKTAKSLEAYTVINGKGLGKYSIVDDISGLIDDIMDLTYIETKYQDDGSIDIEERSKNRSRDDEEKQISKINYDINYRTKDLLQNINISCNSNLDIETLNSVIVTIGDMKFRVTNSTKGGILGPPSGISITTISSPSIESIITQSLNPDTLHDKNIRKQIINGENKYKNIHDLLKFIDTNLNLDIKLLSQDGLKILSTMRSLDGNAIKFNSETMRDFIFFAVKGYYLVNLKIKFEDSKQLNKTFYDWITKQNIELSTLFKDNPSMIENRDWQKLIKTVYSGPTSTWLSKYIEAKLIYSGENFSSTSKNVDRNNDANYSTSFLGGNIRYYLAKYHLNGLQKKQFIQTQKTFIEEELKEANPKQSEVLQQKLKALDYAISDLAVESLFFTDPAHSKFIKKIVVNSGVINQHRKTKLVKNMNSLELFYHDIVHNFFGRLYNPRKHENNSKHNDIIIQPTTFSDKTKFVQYIIDTSRTIMLNGEKKSIINMSEDEYQLCFNEYIGKAYKITYKNILNTFKRILVGEKVNGKIITWDSFNNAEELNAILDNIPLYPESINFLNSDGINKGLIALAQSKGETLLEDTHYRKDKNRGYFNETLAYNAEYLYVNPENLKEFFLELIQFFIKDLENSGLNLYVSDAMDSDSLDIGDTLSKSKYIMAKAIQGFYDKASDRINYYLQWVKNGKLIISKNGVLNPLLLKYFYINSFFSNNLRLELTGSEIAHPNKYKIKVKDLILEWADAEGTNDIKTLNKYLDSYIRAINPTKGTNNVIYTNMIVDRKKIKKEFGEDKFIFLEDAYNSDSNVPKLAVYEALLKVAKENNKTLIVEDSSININDNDKINNVAYLKDTYSNMEFIDTLYLGDAIKDGKFSPKNLHKWLKRLSLKKLASLILVKIENNALGTQLKRNVIIPGTLHYAHLGNLRGISNYTKVAIIEDTQAPVWTFLTDKNGKDLLTVDAHDGSAFQNPIWTILENFSLGSQSVGEDMKPIWHHMNEDTMSATLVKFAVFNISNLRMLDSLGSKIPLENLMKKMTNIQWFTNGKWQTKVDGNNKAIDLTRLSEVGKSELNKEKFMNPDSDKDPKNYFNRYILGDSPLIYQDSENKYWKITNFGKTKEGVYYTEEIEYNNNNLPITGNKVRKYHIYENRTSNILSVISDVAVTLNNNLHTINSIYELWEAMGGYRSVSWNGHAFDISERSNLVVASFVNNVTFRKSSGIKSDLTQHSYELPLKEMMIGYIANVSAVKNGRGNVNLVSSWYDTSDLTYMTLNNAGFGILMDADHSAIDSTMTEFSQVITALEAGSRKHDITKFVYRALGLIAKNACKTELSVVAEYLNSEDRTSAENEIYDIIGRVILNAATGNISRADLTSKIIERIEKQFNKNLGDHKQDIIKIPFSDPNIFSLILSTFIGNVNSTAVKRKYPGSGCVMVPGYNIMQIYKDPLTGNTYKFGDLYNKIIEDEDDPDTDYIGLKTKFYTLGYNITDTQRKTVNAYLIDKQNSLSYTDELEEFIPSDIIDICDNNGNSLINYTDNTPENKKLIEDINLNTFDKYYSFILDKEAWLKRHGFTEDINSYHFRQNIRIPRDLAPARISWSYKLGNTIHKTNIFASKFYKDACTQNEDGSYTFNTQNPSFRKKVQRLLDLLEKGYFDLGDGNPIKIFANSLKNEAAEIIISDIYKNKFETGETSLAKIQDRGEEAFRMSPLPKSPSDVYDIVFRGADGKNTYITFDKINLDKTDKSIKFIPFKDSKVKRIKKHKVTNNNTEGYNTYDVYLLDNYGRPKMKVGRDIIRDGYKFKNGKIVDNNGYDVKHPKRFSESTITKVGADGLLVTEKVIFERIYFIELYEANLIEHSSEKEEDTYMERVPLYRINRKAIEASMDNASSLDVSKFTASIIDEIGKQNTYLGFELSNNLSYSAASNIFDCINFIRSIGPEFESVVLKIYDILKPIRLSLPNIVKEHKENEVCQFDTKAINKLLKVYYKQLAKDRFTSWLQSRFFTVARIPAQSHQSFMLMKAVAYTGSEKNVCHVSHFLTFLQGSDY